MEGEKIDGKQLCVVMMYAEARYLGQAQQGLSPTIVELNKALSRI